MVLVGLKFVMCNHAPSCGTDYHILVLKFDENCSFFQRFKKCFQNKLLLIPLTAQPYNFCSKGATGLKFVMCIYPRHAEPTTKLLFKISTKIVHVFNFFKTFLNIF